MEATSRICTRQTSNPAIELDVRKYPRYHERRMNSPQPRKMTKIEEMELLLQGRKSQKKLLYLHKTSSVKDWLKHCHAQHALPPSWRCRALEAALALPSYFDSSGKFCGSQCLAASIQYFASIFLNSLNAWEIHIQSHPEEYCQCYSSSDWSRGRLIASEALMKTLYMSNLTSFRALSRAHPLVCRLLGTYLICDDKAADWAILENNCPLLIRIMTAVAEITELLTPEKREAAYLKILVNARVLEGALPDRIEIPDSQLYSLARLSLRLAHTVAKKQIGKSTLDERLTIVVHFILKILRFSLSHINLDSTLEELLGTDIVLRLLFDSSLEEDQNYLLTRLRIIFPLRPISEFFTSEAPSQASNSLDRGLVQKLLESCPSGNDESSNLDIYGFINPINNEVFDMVITGTDLMDTLYLKVRRWSRNSVL